MKKKTKKAAGSGDGFNVVKRCHDGMLEFNRNDVFIGRSLELYGEYSEGEAMLFRDCRYAAVGRPPWRPRGGQG